MRQIIVRPLVAAAIASGFVLGGMAAAAPVGATGDVNLTSTPLALVANDDDNDDNDDLFGILSLGSESGDNDDDDDDGDDENGIFGILFL